MPIKSYIANNEASTVFCSVRKHAGSASVQTKCRRKQETLSSVSVYFLSALPLLKPGSNGHAYDS